MTLNNTDLGLPAGLTLAVVLLIHFLGAKFGLVVTRDQLEAKLLTLKAEIERDCVSHSDLAELRQSFTERMNRLEERVDRATERILDALKNQ